MEPPPSAFDVRGGARETEAAAFVARPPLLWLDAELGGGGRMRGVLEAERLLEMGTVRLSDRLDWENEKMVEKKEKRFISWCYVTVSKGKKKHAGLGSKKYIK